MKTSRLEAFSDGVLAIIITIMVLELKVPAGDTLGDLRRTSGTSLLTYLLSFVFVGIYWNNHHHTFHLVRRTTGAVLWANLALLFFLSLFPFSTAWMDGTDFARTPVVTYGVNLLVAAIAYGLLLRVIIRHEGRDSPLSRAVGHDLKGNGSILLYVAAIVSGIIDAHVGVWIAIALYVVVAIIWLVPDRRIDRVVRDDGLP